MEPVPGHDLGRRVLALPDLEFLFFDLVVVIDHQTRTLQMVFTPAPDRLLSESHEALHNAPWRPLLEGGGDQPEP